MQEGKQRAAVGVRKLLEQSGAAEARLSKRAARMIA